MMNAMNISFLIASSPTFAPFARARFGVPRPAEGYRPDFLRPLQHFGIDRRALYATDIRKANHGIPFSLCDCLCPSMPLERADSARIKLWSNFRGLHHAEDSNCTGCILGDAERCRRCRPASQGAAASGACSGWQVSGRQVSAWQISTSSARRDQGLTVSGALNARKIERSGVGIPFPLMPRFGGALSLGIVEVMGTNLAPALAPSGPRLRT